MNHSRESAHWNFFSVWKWSSSIWNSSKSDKNIVRDTQVIPFMTLSNKKSLRAINWIISIDFDERVVWKWLGPIRPMHVGYLFWCITNILFYKPQDFTTRVNITTAYVMRIVFYRLPWNRVASNQASRSEPQLATPRNPKFSKWTHTLFQIAGQAVNHGAEETYRND